MFVFSFKASTLKYIGVMSLSVMAIILTVALVPSHSLSTDFDGSAVQVSAERKTADFKNIKTNEDRISLLNSYGWEVGDEELSSQRVVIPETFDETYASYNELQKKSGFDLKKYRGKEAILYTYEVTNADEKAFANLLVYKNRVIAADVTSANPEGFSQGLNK